MKRLMLCVCALWVLGCGGDDDDKSEADRLGVGASCTADDACQEGLKCLTDFKGGYCGLTGCDLEENACPEASACVTHDDGVNYCFRACADKPECNANRGAEEESNCASNVEFVDEALKIKACVPPS